MSLGWSFNENDNRKGLRVSNIKTRGGAVQTRKTIRDGSVRTQVETRKRIVRGKDFERGTVIGVNLVCVKRDSGKEILRKMEPLGIET